MTDYNSTFKLLYLVSCINSGTNEMWKLLDEFESFDGIYEAFVSEKYNRFFTEEALSCKKRVHDNQIEGIISYCGSHNIGILSYDDELYPDMLRKIYNPPALLFYRGNAEILSSNIIFTMVGSRDVSDYGQRVTKATAAVLAANGVPIASGFAVGTDIAAHLAAVRNGGKTIAVLGCGLDYDYPSANIRYRDEILENGVFISEYFPLTQANTIHFPARNRILSGMSIGTAVMEAAEKSGSLNTASHALSQGRDIWAVPPADIFDPRYNGCKKLLKDGAVPIYSPYDIIEEYFENFSHKSVHEITTDYIFLDNMEREPNDNKKSVRSAAKSSKKKSKEVSSLQNENIEPELYGNAKIIYDILKKSGSPLSPDNVSEKAGIDISEVLSVITDLEIDGAVSTESGQTYYVL